MSQALQKVVQGIISILPANAVNEVSCYAFYDHHPRDNKKIDVITCSKAGELKEFHQRELVGSTTLPICLTPKEILVLRSYNCELFYLVATSEEVVLVTRRKDELVAYKKISNVERYELYDSSCRGQASLIVTCRDDAVPHIFDDNFVSMADKVSIMNCINVDDSMPVMTQLKRKLNEAKYSVMHNEMSLKEFTSLRQATAFSISQKTVPKMCNSMSRVDADESGALLLKSKEPWVKLCNGYIVIFLNVKNTSLNELRDINILLHGNTKPSIVYKTRLFDKLPTSPYWKEKDRYIMLPESEMTIAVVVALKEFESYITSKIEFNGVICYKEADGKDHVLMFSNVYVTAIKRMALEFDVLADPEKDVPYTILALLATTEKKDFCIRHINVNLEEQMDLSEIFVRYLEMERVGNTGVFVHRTTPYHTLYGTMVMVHEPNVNKLIVSVYTRSQFQQLSLLHYIHDKVPLTLVATTTNLHIISKFPSALSIYTEKSPPTTEMRLELKEYCEGIEKQIVSIINYADDCLVKMNQSKDPLVRSKVSSHVDLFMGGSEAFLAFRKELLDEAVNNIRYSEFDCDDDDASVDYDLE